MKSFIPPITTEEEKIEAIRTRVTRIRVQHREAIGGHKLNLWLLEVGLQNEQKDCPHRTIRSGVCETCCKEFH
jgi:hypothetical protein